MFLIHIDHVCFIRFQMRGALTLTTCAAVVSLCYLTEVYADADVLAALERENELSMVSVKGNRFYGLG